jgi:hypothetical protein
VQIDKFAYKRGRREYVGTRKHESESERDIKKRELGEGRKRRETGVRGGGG